LAQLRIVFAGTSAGKLALRRLLDFHFVVRRQYESTATMEFMW
jgi:hypothetical protein